MFVKYLYSEKETIFFIMQKEILDPNFPWNSNISVSIQVVHLIYLYSLAMQFNLSLKPII